MPFVVANEQIGTICRRNKLNIAILSTKKKLVVYPTYCDDVFYYIAISLNMAPMIYSDVL